MELKIFKTLWGFHGTLEEAVLKAEERGIDGIEAQAPESIQEQYQLASLLEEHGLSLVGEIITGGDYVPNRRFTPEQHLTDLETALKRYENLSPLKINCITGCDAWSEKKNIDYFNRAMDLGDQYGQQLCFETHRSRSFFTPWNTETIVSQLPELKLTADFSHWCVVCERLIDTELDVIEALAPQIAHIHARVGYDQGPQVPHPAAPEYAAAVEAHQRWWEMIWTAQLQQQTQISTMTPEFGPDGYLHQLPFTQVPIADLEQINNWMADLEAHHFHKFIAAQA